MCGHQKRWWILLNVFSTAKCTPLNGDAWSWSRIFIPEHYWNINLKDWGFSVQEKPSVVENAFTHSEFVLPRPIFQHFGRIDAALLPLASLSWNFKISSRTVEKPQENTANSVVLLLLHFLYIRRLYTPNYYLTIQCIFLRVGASALFFSDHSTGFPCSCQSHFKGNRLSTTTNQFFFLSRSPVWFFWRSSW